IGWIVDVTTLGATLIYGMICHAVYKHAQASRARREQYTGIIGLLLMAVFLLFLLVPGLLPFHAMETESYVLFIIWAVLGLAYFHRLVRKDPFREYSRRFLVWLILLVLVLFASMMWVSRATENAAETAVAEILEYHESHPTDDSDDHVKEERIDFLARQAKKISSTNILFTMVSLGLFLLSTLILLNNYRDTHALRLKLSAAEKEAYARLHALAGDYLCVYVVVPETGVYREFSAIEDYESFGQAKEGEDFFAVTRDAARKYNHPEDLERFLAMFTKENVLAEIRRNGIFTITYRLVNEGISKYVQLKAAMVEEEEGQRLIVGINDIDANVRQEEEHARHLAQAQSKANVDALTGVKSKYAWQNAEEQLGREIAEHRSSEFAITVLDVNDLKKVNDLKGHQAGDRYLCDACKIICTIFKHSPVFRIGGDEFAVLSRGEDYARVEELVEKVSDHNAMALQTGGIVIACGMAKYRDEETVTEVFACADQRMYENKRLLKAERE
ncbi:MAG: GGDEF domain-containing protein, partial [bacterium]